MFGTITDRLIATIISVGSLFFPFIDGIEPAFNDVWLSIVENSLVLSMQLENCYTAELDKILMSGQPVTLRFRAELFDKAQKQPVLTKQFYHTLRYNPLEKQYRLYSSEKDNNDYYSTLQLVHLNFSSLSGVKLLKPGDLEKEHDYFIRLTAHLDPITFIGEKSDFDLMLYWNNKKPAVNTETFNISLFYH
ncbi:MAG: DUF4390 domain-containing protein [Candidatus Marinimicrobia bacterium]|nr:DUF4390 domain-containing protein [Candidatus Neomarinimicrobiota bacterium]